MILRWFIFIYCMKELNFEAWIISIFLFIDLICTIIFRYYQFYKIDVICDNQMRVHRETNSTLTHVKHIITLIEGAEKNNDR